MKGKLCSIVALIGALAAIPATTVYGNGWEDEWKKKIVELATEDYVVNATKEMRSAFAEVREENGLDSVDPLRAELEQFYNDGFVKIYAEKTGEEIADVNTLINSLDDDSIALQHYYMTTNPHPVGEKHLLDQADDQSTWSKLHGQYHPKFRDYLEAAKLYDIFLIDLDSGDIFYSVFKEIDFTTSVTDGPYAEVFKEAFQAVKDAGEDNFANTLFSIYQPSYDDVAYFFMTPVYDGTEKVGALMIQVPL